MIPVTNNQKMTNYIRTKTVLFSNYKNETYNRPIISSSNTGMELKTPHEDEHRWYADECTKSPVYDDLDRIDHHLPTRWRTVKHAEYHNL